MQLNTKQIPNWSKEEMRDELNEFIQIYSERPIKKNISGMRFSHMFAFYFMLKNLNPEFVIESGVLRGQGTWLIEKTLPNARILSIDIKLHLREYISNRAEYSSLDFKFHDFSQIDPNKTLVFFDDHQNCIERLKECKWFGIKHVIFEDNYPPNEGDCYTLRQVVSGSGYKIRENIFYERLKGLIIFLWFQIHAIFKNKYPFIDHRRFRANHVKPNMIDLKYINKNIEIYYEFPPVTDPTSDFKENFNHYHNSAKHHHYKTKEPLLTEAEEDKFKIAFDENSYNWIVYVRLC